MQGKEAFRKAIDLVGGVVAAIPITGKGQSTISGYLKDGNAPAEVCMRLEVATKRIVLADEMRPDLANTFKAFREAAAQRRPTAAQSKSPAPRRRAA